MGLWNRGSIGRPIASTRFIQESLSFLIERLVLILYGDPLDIAEDMDPSLLLMLPTTTTTTHYATSFDRLAEALMVHIPHQLVEILILNQSLILVFIAQVQLVCGEPLWHLESVCFLHEYVLGTGCLAG